MLYELKTDIKNDAIIQKLVLDKREMLARWVLDTRDDDIRESLIKLGWTPPPVDGKKCTCIVNICCPIHGNLDKSKTK